MTRFLEVLFVVVIFGMIVSLLGVIGAIGSEIRPYCFVAFPVFLVSFVLIKRKLRPDRNFSDTPWDI